MIGKDVKRYEHNHRLKILKQRILDKKSSDNRTLNNSPPLSFVTRQNIIKISKSPTQKYKETKENIGILTRLTEIQNRKNTINPTWRVSPKSSNADARRALKNR